jgi:hypothetical protein
MRSWTHLQIELDNRPLAKRGLCATIEVHASGTSCEETEADASAPEYHGRFSDTSRSMSTFIRSAIAYSDVRNGASGNLYSPFQLHLLRRKIAQIRLLSIEVMELRRSYNQKFAAVSVSKEAAVAKIEGNLERICVIQNELKLTAMPNWVSSSSDEDETRCIRVEPHEMSTSPWMTAAQRYSSHHLCNRTPELTDMCKHERDQCSANSLTDV